MIKYEILNLEEIKDIISSFNDLQSAFNLLHSISDEFRTYNIQIDDSIISKENLLDLKTISSSIQSLIHDLFPVTNHNIHIFNEFQNELLSKFKRSYKARLKDLGLNKKNLQHLGNSLIKSKKISKIVSNISYIYSLKLTQWLELIDSLKQNSIFNNIVQKLNTFYQELIEDKLSKQLSTIQGKFDESIINDYKEAFYKQPNLTFSEYQHLHKTSLSKDELKEKKEIIKKEQDKLELEKLKENQVQQDELYQDYLRLPNKEFERKRRKKRREKLNKIDLNEKNNNKIEISKETYEKIEKFKSSFDEPLKNKYLVQETEDKSPIELIRERKKKKSEEFKRYKKHFEAE
jgi:hypothetical protein